MKIKYNPPLFIKKCFSKFYWNSSNKKILLTFDDGPNPLITNKILEELDKHKIKALFFCVGENIEKYPELVKNILANGHTIGNHTLSHKRIANLNHLERENEVDWVTTLLLEKYGYQINYFRPPDGRFSFRTQKFMDQRNLQMVMWSLLTYDYKNNLDIVKFAVEKNLNVDSIIVLHDNPKCQQIIVDSIRFIIKEAKQRGFEFGEPSECLR
ncbi:MAG: polysaccharide deacetylase family protein [Ignavibacteriales bacterium]|nr:polysaccharide deacetylase family protein [Ignavibacteriales bacterium]